MEIAASSFVRQPKSFGVNRNSHRPVIFFSTRCVFEFKENQHNAQNFARPFQHSPTHSHEPSSKARCSSVYQRRVDPFPADTLNNAIHLLDQLDPQFSQECSVQRQGNIFPPCLLTIATTPSPVFEFRTYFAIASGVPRLVRILISPVAFSGNHSMKNLIPLTPVATVFCASPVGSLPFAGLLPTYRYSFVSPAVNPVGSGLIHRPRT